MHSWKSAAALVPKCGHIPQQRNLQVASSAVRAHRFYSSRFGSVRWNDHDQEQAGFFTNASDQNVKHEANLSAISNKLEASNCMVWADLRAKLDACISAEEIRSTTTAVYWANLLRNERQNLNEPLPNNEELLLYLASHEPLQNVSDFTQLSVSAARLRDQNLMKHLLLCVSQVGHHRFSLEFFDGITQSLSLNRPMPLTVDALADLMLRRFLSPVQTKALKPRSATTGPVATSQQGTDIAKLFRVLFKCLSHAGKSTRIDECFRALRASNVPLDIIIYQYQLIAMANMRTEQAVKLDQESRKKHKSYVEVESSHDVALTERVQAEIMTLKKWMDQDNIEVDDKFLATVVMAMSAPLRRPLCRYTTPERTLTALKIVRSIGAQAISSKSEKGKYSQDEIKPKSRLISAIVNAELDSLRSLLSADQIKGNLSKKDDGAKDKVPGRIAPKSALDTDSLSRLDAVFAQIRLATLQDGCSEVLCLLKSLLDIDSDASRNSTRRTDVILKQRSAVIIAFSQACLRRTVELKQDPCLQVLDLVVRHPHFAKIWHCVLPPANASRRLSEKHCDPTYILARLWKRWTRSWSFDVVSHNTQRDAGLVRNDSDDAATSEALVPSHRTFAGQNPWKTWARGSKLFTQTLDQLAAIPGNNDDQVIRNEDFASIFYEKTCLDTIVRVALRGGRNPIDPENTDKFASVQSRLTHLFELLGRIRVKPMVWDRLETFLLGNIARMEKHCLTTDQIRSLIQEVRSRREVAVMKRDHTLLRRQQVQSQLRREAWSDPYPQIEDGDFESASVFVLRNLILKI